jgi:hypothetical protein
MKNNKSLIAIIPFLLLSLSSCSKERDPYEFKESEPLSDKELGLGNISYSFENYNKLLFEAKSTLDPTTDNEYLTYDPLSKVDQASLDAGWANLNEDDSSLDQDTYPALWRKHFKGSTYKTYSSSTLQNDSPFYYKAVFKRKNPYDYFTEYDESTALVSIMLNTYPQYDTLFFPSRVNFTISAVESNGVYSYIFDSDLIMGKKTFTYDKDHGILYYTKYAAKLFLALRFNAYYPYRIYFDHRYVYAMSYDEKFSKEYIKSFNEEEDLHLFRL